MTQTNGNEQQALKERRKYIDSWYSLMVKIWKERIDRLGVIDTGGLLKSVTEVQSRVSADYTQGQLMHGFREYGIWQNYGSGRETPRGVDSKTIFAHKRKRRPWLSKKYYSSIMNMKEFLSDNIGRQFVGIMLDTLRDLDFRRRYGQGTTNSFASEIQKYLS